MFRFAYGYAPSDKVEKLEAKAKAPNAPCQKQMIAWIDCMKGAQASYAEEGKDTSDPSSWAYYHLKKCLNPYIEARECQVDKKVEVVRQMKKKVSPEQWELIQKRMRLAAHKKIGVDKFDEIWSPDLDYTAYFQAYRAHMENQFKLEEEFLKDIEGGASPADPGKYLPKKFYGNTQVFFDETEKQK